MSTQRTVSTPGELRIDSTVFGLACNECRLQLEVDWQFCAHCEVRLSTSCPRCGVPLPPAGSRHCGHCGLALARS
jgi:predicted amidophosphoribosyltransferase